MKCFLPLVFTVFLMFSCSKKESLPPGVFPVNTMKMMVWDLEYAGQKASDHFPLQKDSLRMESTSLYGQVFAKYKTDKKTFYNSFAYYESHPILLKVLFDSVAKYGGRQKEIFYKKSY